MAPTWTADMSHDAAESDRERLAQREAEAARAARAAAEESTAEQVEAEQKAPAKAERATRSSSGRAASPFDSLLRSAGTVLGRELTRTILGTLKRR